MTLSASRHSCGPFLSWAAAGEANGARALRALRGWISCFTSSLPVPDSPEQITKTAIITGGAVIVADLVYCQL